MCGIAGFVAPQVDGADEWAGSAERALRHRGPDDAQTSFWSVEGRPASRPSQRQVGLVHRRLSIIDLSPGGRQPRTSRDGQFVLCFNGEVYNYLELRRELELTQARTFSSASDSEVLVEAWSAWGPACVSRLVGMFAFALLDLRQRTMFLVRDPVGIKPLFYVDTPRGLAFASEPAPLLDWPGVTRRLNPQAVADYLRFGFSDHLPQSMFADIGHVPAGSICEVPFEEPQRLRTTRFWTAEPRTTLDLPVDEAAKTLRELLVESVGLHLRADVPVASCLSGGIDSSSIVMLMRQVGGPGVDIHTFSHVARGTPFDEERYVDTVNAASGATPHKVESHPEDLLRELPALIRAQQAPFSTTSIFAQYRVFQALHESGLKVTLDGQGADELFGGYGFHIGARLGSLVKQGKFGAAKRLLAAAKHLPGLSGKTHVSNMLDYLLPPGLQRAARRGAGKSVTPPWMDAAWCDSRGVTPDPYRTAESKELLREALCRSLAGPGLPHLLRYEDHNSMAFGVEARVPYLSQPVIEFALSLPEHLLVSDQAGTKCLLRRAMRGIVPDEVLDRKDKVAFQTPEDQWMRALAPWIDQALASDRARTLQVLDLDQARRHWEAVKSGQRPYGPVVWRWANLIEWARQFEVTED